MQSTHRTDSSSQADAYGGWGLQRRDLKPLKADRFGYAEARHLLNRAGFGGTPDQIRTLVEWGLERSVQHIVQVNDVGGYPNSDPRQFRSDIMAPVSQEQRREYQRALRAGNEDVVDRFRRERQRKQRDDRGQIAEMQQWWIQRMVETTRPLEEKLTLFWHSHFATSYRAIENSYHMFMQNNFFREHAAGNFGDLLRGIVRDPAMLAYLNNQQNRKGSPNENLARELMELFSLGRGNYTEQDIKEGARALTGYHYQYNEFRFRSGAHDSGSKRILGQRGSHDGDDFVRILLEQRACAEFVGRKLYRYFVTDVADRPRDRSEQNRSAGMEVFCKLLRDSNYEIGTTLSTLFTSEHFYHPSVRTERIKSPVELLVGAARQLHAPLRSLGTAADALELMGQDLFFPPNVAGWPGGRSWVNTSTLYVRQNLMNFMLTGRLPSGYDEQSDEERYDTAMVLTEARRIGDNRITQQSLVDAVLSMTLGDAATSSHHDALVSFTEQVRGASNEQLALGLLVLASAAPEYNLC